MEENTIEIPVLLSRYWQLRSNQRAVEPYDLLAEMAHEVKNPLSVILCTIQNIASDRIDEFVAHDIPVIQNSALRMKRIISAMLDNQKLYSGNTNSNPTPINLREFIKQIETETQSLNKNSRLHIEANIEPNVPTTVLLDRDLLHRILDNLLSNALKFTRQGSITVGLKFDPQTITLHFLVSDTGKGMTRFQKMMLFKRYSQVGNTQFKKMGNGIGLCASHTAASAMGGRLVLLSSEVDVGTNFQLTLPCVTEPPVVRISDPRHILVVDDDESIRHVVRCVLKNRFPNAEVTLAENASDTHRIIQQANHLDLFITDYHLGDVVGPDLIHFVKNRFPTCQNIIMSALAKNHSNISSLNSNIGYIDKSNLINGLNDFYFHPVRSRLLPTSNNGEVKKPANKEGQPMTQITPVSIKEATGETLDILNSVKQTIGSVPNLIATMANSPAIVSGYLAFSQSLANANLSAKLREKIALTVGETNECEYCVAAHNSIGLKTGLSKIDIDLARRATSQDSKENAALQFARAVVVNRAKLDASAINRLRLVGYSDSDIVEIVGHIALNIFTNYFNHIAGTEVDFPKPPQLDQSDERLSQ